MPQPPLPSAFFSTLLPELATRATRATVSRLGFSNPALRQHLNERFSVELGEPGCFVGEPVFEATFGWQTADNTLASLAPGLLTPQLVQALDCPAGGEQGNYRFAKDSRPYRHQLEAWNLLAQEQPQSVIVTSGTGSGKTECFMVPILDQLAREAANNPGPIEGVRALFLYPLNALIQSQQERLQAWTGPFGDQIRFCLYNGNTPEKPGPQHLANQRTNQVLDRKTLRNSPPPILVTNATMLEYMLVRAQDASILEKSKGQLQWIVLDEAHSYIGSQAAELALLLRRVLHGFGVQAEQVRFVATSATIGDPAGEAGKKLKAFLADLAGVTPERVHVVAGHRQVPVLPDNSSLLTREQDTAPEALQAVSEVTRYQALCANGTAIAIRRLFVPDEGGKAARPLSDVCAVLAGPAERHSPATQLLALRWLDCLTGTREAQAGGSVPFLPLRLHAFHNILPGLWACCDRQCRCRQATALDSEDWAFGAVYTEERQTCECGAPVYELRSCNDCNETYLWARLSGHARPPTLVQDTQESNDDFELDELSEEDPEATLAEAATEDRVLEMTESPWVLVANRHSVATEATLDKGSRALDSGADVPKVKVRLCEEDQGQLRCPECGGHHDQATRLFRAARLGAPFLLLQVIPTLLEFSPDGATPADSPLRGRRMITFTDSRQGTARTAATLQRDAERNVLRSAVYRMLASQPIAEHPERVRLLEDIKICQEDFDATGLPRFQTRLEALKRQLEQFPSQQAAPVPFNELAAKLASNEPDIQRWALDYYNEISPGQFSHNDGLELAKLFLFREFARRPKRGNSLETLGLVSVQYLKLAAVQALPAGVATLPEMDLTVWRQTLKLVLDFVVREQSCIAFPLNWKKWIGKGTFNARFLHPQSNDQPGSYQRRWPKTQNSTRQSRIVRLLAEAFGLDPQQPEGRDHLDSILSAAWDELRRVGLLNREGDGVCLALDDLAFALIGPAWMCPVTRSVLDVSLLRLTPYLPGPGRQAHHIECTPIEVPQWPDMRRDFVEVADRVRAARAWLAHDPQVQALRALGLWSNLNDRVVEGVGYYRTAEHSAQQPARKLQDYEDRFKSGSINLLSCSTTMEMGVDIGGISVVAMNNVPPHPANYLQRAGRAGRRSETRSIALTVCKNNPHDQMVFKRPTWPFTTQLPAPVIKLESPVIVQRHLNSMWLAHRLWALMEQAPDNGNDIPKLNLAWWALPKGQSKADEFLASLRCFDPQQDEHLSNGLRSLLKSTCFEGTTPLATLAAEAARMMESLLAGWYGEYESVQQQLDRFDTPALQDDPAYRALNMQRQRLTDEYLLKELAGGGFLPAYGFPGQITSFDTLHLEQLRQEKSKPKQDREDNRWLRRDLPSRDSVTALREYAPGAEVVMDGLVFRSAGVTLNWHAPAEVDVNQIQSIRQAWRCGRCGASGTEINRAGHDHCEACGEPLDPKNRFTYLEPAGFAVDLYEDPHTDVSTQSFVPVKKPWVNAEGTWQALSNPALGRFRSSPTGRVFNYSSGAHDRGYAICLECGHAEPMLPSTDERDQHGRGHLPALFSKPHRRLRGGRGPGNESGLCAGSEKPFAIKPYLHLGLEEVTDVLELQLNGLDGLPIADKIAAYSIAVALRDAVAEELGVETGEIGCDIKPMRHPSQNRNGQVIVLYDHSAAGYCSSVADRLPELLSKARDKLLSCAGNCPSACQHCLLEFDTRFRMDELDRHAATAFLNPEWMQRLGLQAEDRLFGADASQAETQRLPEAVTREWSKAGQWEVRLFGQGDPADWDFSAASFKRHLTRWSERGPVTLLLSAQALDQLTPEQQGALGRLQSSTDLKVYRQPSIPTGLLVELMHSDTGRSTCWASRDPQSGNLGESWGQMGTTVLVRAQGQTPQVLGDSVVLQAQTPVARAANSGHLDIKSQLDGPVDKFGNRLLMLLNQAAAGQLLDSAADITTVVYRDRYLNSPLPAALLIDFLATIKEVHQVQWDNPTIEIITIDLAEAPPHQPPPSQVFQNWPSTAMRDDGVRAGFARRGMEAVVRKLPKHLASHARTLEIIQADKRKTKLWLDQGFGYWNSPRNGARGAQSATTWFNFHADIERQAEELTEARYVIEGQVFPTHIFFAKD